MVLLSILIVCAIIDAEGKHSETSPRLMFCAEAPYLLRASRQA
jgi:hypothetical protein